MEINLIIRGGDYIHKHVTEERSPIFVKEPEGSSEKILKYVKCTYGRIFVPSQKKNDYLRMYNLQYFQTD